MVDSAGQLLTQLRPSLLRAGDPADWTASRCVWKGQNQYGFDLGGIPDAPFSPLSRVADHLN